MCSKNRWALQSYDTYNVGAVFYYMRHDSSLALYNISGANTNAARTVQQHLLILSGTKLFTPPEVMLPN